MLQSRFKFNLRFKTVGEVVARLCALLLYAAGARLLGADGFGLFSLAFSYAVLASVLIDSGTLNILTRNLARDRTSAPELISTVTLYKCYVAPVAVLAIYGLVYFLDEGGQTASLIRVTVLVAVGTAMSEHLSAILSGLERMDIEALMKVINRVGVLAFAVAFFYLDRSVGGFTFGMAVGLWLSIAFGFWWIHRNIGRLSRTMNRTLLKDTLRTGAPLFVAWLFITLYNNQDRYILSMLGFSKTDIGVYSASAKLIDALRPIPVLLMGAVFPIVSEAAVKDRALFEKIAVTLVKYSVIGLFPFSFAVTVFSPEIVRAVFGPQFSVTAGILAVAIWGFVGVFLNHLFLYLFVSADQQKKFFQGAVISMVVNAPLCWYLLQAHGLVGGAWALVGSEGALLIFNITVSSWARRHVLTLFAKPAVLASVSLLLFFFLRLWIPPTPAFAAAVALYGLLVWRASLVDVGLLRRFIV